MHGDSLLDLIRERQPSLVNRWAVKASGEIIGKEARKLAEYLHPAQGQEVSEVLANISLERILSDAEKMAPKFCDLLRMVSTKENTSPDAEEQKDHDLVSIPDIIVSYY